jgi:hypothetical protein
MNCCIEQSKALNSSHLPTTAGGQYLLSHSLSADDVDLDIETILKCLPHNWEKGEAPRKKCRKFIGKVTF